MNWMDIKLTPKDLDITACQCCLISPGDGLFKDYRELKNGSIMKLYVCKTCLNLDDRALWERRVTAYKRQRKSIVNPMDGEKKKRYRSWRFRGVRFKRKPTIFI